MISLDVQKSKKIPIPALNSNPMSASILTPRVQKLRWEKTLPKTLTIANMERISTLLKLKVEIETTNTVEKKSVMALLDSGATGECIDRDDAKSQQFKLIKLTQPIPVYNIDGSPNEASSIKEVVSLILHYKNHLEQTTFCQGTPLKLIPITKSDAPAPAFYIPPHHRRIQEESQ